MGVQGTRERKETTVLLRRVSEPSFQTRTANSEVTGASVIRPQGAGEP